MTNLKEKPNPPKLMSELKEQLSPSFDVLLIPLQLEEEAAFLLYLKTAVDGDKLQNMIIKPFFEMKSMQHYASYVQSSPDILEIKSEEKIPLELTKGSVLIAVQHQFFLIDVKKVNTSTVQQTLMEPTVYGPQQALSEDILTNLNIIRHRYKEPTLKIEILELKDKTHNDIAIIYDDQTVKPAILKTIRKRLEGLDSPLIQSAGELQLYLNGKKFTLFPTLMLTERPDRICYNLDAGKVIIMIDGSPHALIAPVVFFDFMVSMEDNYHLFWITSFTLVLRYFGLITCLILPALYVAITSYNPDIFRTELALTVAGSRIGVPYPSFIEVLFMLIFMELLTEASIRLPKAISATATTVGGLILGSAATEAALTSNIMIIIVSAVAISSFVIPINEMSFSIRFCRYILLAFTTFFWYSRFHIGLFRDSYVFNK
ncbi:spore germination protein [Psychrobacillus sp. NEAU-3TGS]|uniref:spore germination protein n=1 Tax=Psychrobacillus sp. NEAU-3TGS TaxID=2995412 RepID=UPI0024992A99|nr:spore germination protein [Psychrobacillus sp. NEAU-3TGS]MDI2587920.1 spore germination protein [Psychrobacillus sp. NEAU-3TGS]